MSLSREDDVREDLERMMIHNWSKMAVDREAQKRTVGQNKF
jgi:hypothetical protein